MRKQQSLVQSRKHELKCQLCAGEIPEGVHTAQGRITALSVLCESHTGTYKHVCTSTHAEKLSSHISCTVLHLQHVHRLYAYYPWRTDIAVKH